jgi:hypothetical protein
VIWFARPIATTVRPAVLATLNGHIDRQPIRFEPDRIVASVASHGCGELLVFPTTFDHDAVGFVLGAQPAVFHRRAAAEERPVGGKDTDFFLLGHRPHDHWQHHQAGGEEGRVDLILHNLLVVAEETAVSHDGTQLRRRGFSITRILSAQNAIPVDYQDSSKRSIKPPVASSVSTVHHEHS